LRSFCSSSRWFAISFWFWLSFEFCNHRWYHERVENAAPSEIQHSWREEILRQRAEQKRQTRYERFRYNFGRKANRTIGEPEAQNRCLSDSLNHSQRC
jgi:hypothetical protein